MSDPIPFEVTALEDRTVAGNGTATMTVLNGGALFRRRAVKGMGSGNARRVEWAVGELNGVRCYFDGSHVILTTQDLRP